MKNVAFAGALAAALCLTGVAQQRAAAQDCRRGFEISANMSYTFGLHWTRDGNRGGACGYPGCGPYGCSFAGNNSAAPYAYASPYYGAPYAYGAVPFAALQPAQAAPAAPASPSQATPKTKTDAAEVQNIGYTYPVYYYDYNYANSYPYPQDSAYWYGY